MSTNHTPLSAMLNLMRAVVIVVLAAAWTVGLLWAGATLTAGDAPPENPVTLCTNHPSLDSCERLGL